MRSRPITSLWMVVMMAAALAINGVGIVSLTAGTALADVANEPESCTAEQGCASCEASCNGTQNAECGCDSFCQEEDPDGNCVELEIHCVCYCAGDPEYPGYIVTQTCTWTPGSNG